MTKTQNTVSFQYDHNKICSKTQPKLQKIAILTHLGCIFFFIIPPLVVYLVSKDKFVKDNAKEALNFQISIAIYSIISGILMFVLIGFIGFIGIIFIFIANQALPIIAAINVSFGKPYKYPFLIRFLK